MKKLLLLIGILSTLIIGGCTQSKSTIIESQEFTDEQNEILSLTGNRAFKYKLKNLPEDKKYELDIVYEVYKNKEKLSEKSILGMAYGPAYDKIEDSNISINIQENKISIMSDSAYSTLEIEEGISNLTNYYFNGSRKIDIGDEVYLFHASDGGEYLSAEKLGSLSEDDLDKLIDVNEVNTFIKLIFKEIEVKK